MNEQSMSVEQFNELIQKWSGKTVKITKQELDDEDTIIMKLEDVTYQTDTRRIDEYDPMHTVLFNGTGMTQTDNQTTQPLPQSVYEIPLEDSTQYHFDDNIRFSITTERGVYTIELIN